MKGGKLYWHEAGAIFGARADGAPIPITTRLGGHEPAETLAVFFDDVSESFADEAREHVIRCARELRVAVREARAWQLENHPVLKHWPKDSLVGRARDASVRL